MSLLVTAGLLFVLFTQIESGDDPTALSYSAFLEQVDAGAVATAEIHTDGSVEGELVATGTDDEPGTDADAVVAGEPYTTTVPVGLAGDALLDRLEAHGVVVTAVVDTASGGTQVLGWLFALLPFVALAGLWVWMARRAKGGGGAMTSVFGMGRSKVTITDPEHPTTTFADVAGYDGVKREVAEIIEFLREPTRFARRRCGRPSRGADDRTAGDRQDPARPGRRRRGGRAVPLGHGIVASSRCSSGSVPLGSATCSPRRGSWRPRSSSSTRSTPSASAARAVRW